MRPTADLTPNWHIYFPTPPCKGNISALELAIVTNKVSL